MSYKEKLQFSPWKFVNELQIRCMFIESEACIEKRTDKQNGNKRKWKSGGQDVCM